MDIITNLTEKFPEFTHIVTMVKEGQYEKLYRFVQMIRIFLNKEQCLT